MKNHLKFIKKIPAIIGICCLLFTLQTTAQTWEYSNTHFGKDDGLPSNVVYCMVSDKDGFLWIGTDAGLVKFDGSHFKIFTTQDGLPSNDIFILYCDSKNRVWMTGMSKNTAYVFKNKIYNKSNSELVSKIKIEKQNIAIFEDESKQLHFITTPFLLYDIDTLNKVTEKNFYNKYGHLSNFFYTNSNYYFITIDSNYIYSSKKNEIKSIKNSTNPIQINGLKVVDSTIYYISSENNKLYKFPVKSLENVFFKTETINWKLFSNTNNELIHIHNNGLDIYNQKNINTVYLKLFEGESVSNYLYDSLKNTWVSSLGNGLDKINSISAKIYRNKENSRFNKFYSVTLNNKQIFLGDNNCRVSIIDKQNLKLISTQTLNPENYISSRVLKISNYSTNKLFITTDLGYYNYDIKQKQTINASIKNLSCKNHFIINDTIYVVTNGMFYKINKANHSTIAFNLNKRCYSYYHFFDTKFVGAEDGIYTLQDKKIIPYKLNEPFTNRVMDIASIDSTIILATINSGLYFIKNHQIVKKINNKNGLSSNNCFKIIPYKNKFYIPTNNGLNIYNPTTQKISRLYECDGLASNTVNDIAIENDTLYAATDNGLSIISLNDIDTNKNFKLFTKPIIVNKDTIWNKDSIFFKTRTDWTFKVILNSLSFHTKGDIIYQYSYLPNNEINTTKDQEIKLKFPKPGTYFFKVKAKDVNDFYSNEVVLTIQVEPYFRQTICYKIALVLIGCLLFYVLFKFQINRIRKKENQQKEIDAKIQQLELSLWRSKINPHFLFNSLNSIISLIKTNRSNQAVDFLGNFSSILRKTIQNSDKLLYTIQDEIKYIQEYLEIEKIKRDSLFDYKIAVENVSIYNLLIPTLILQPVVENSIKHGIKANKNGLIAINFYEKENNIICTIEDNGDGLIEQTNIEKKSFGIELIYLKIKLIEEILGKKIYYKLENKIEGNTGTITTFIFPKITQSEYDSYNINR